MSSETTPSLENQQDNLIPTHQNHCAEPLAGRTQSQPKNGSGCLTPDPAVVPLSKRLAQCVVVRPSASSASAWNRRASLPRKFDKWRGPAIWCAASSATMSIPSVIAAAGYPSRSSSMASSRIFWAMVSHSDFSSILPLPDLQSCPQSAHSGQQLDRSPISLSAHPV